MQWRLGKYRGQWCAVTGQGPQRKRRALGKDRGEAERIIHQLNNARPPGVTVEWLWHAYCAEKEGRAVIETMRHTAKAILPHFGHHDPEEITHEVCAEYIQRRREVGRADGTIHTELGHLATVVYWGQKRRYIGAAPHISRPSKPAARDRHLTRDEARRLIDAATTPHVRLAIILLLGTAARIRAVLDLTWDRVDFDRGLIHLRDPDDTTRRKGRAVVPMNAMVRAALSEAHTGALTGHVIEWGGRPVKSLKKGLGTAAARAGLRVTAHDLRHTAAVWMAEAGISMDEIAQYLGHSDVSVTRRIYARFSPDYLRGAADAVNLDMGPSEAGSMQNAQRALRK